jgi:ubiquinone/menaquinone biosynthesis C-methylase UbiE
MSAARIRRHGIGSTALPTSTAHARTRAFYEERAEAYAAATRDTDLGILWSRFEALVRPGSQMVDLGCGSGRDMRRFANEGLMPIGLDRSFPLCRIAAQFSGCPTVAGDVRALPFCSGAFEGAWVAAVLLHLPAPDVAIAVAEIHRVLRPGGTAMISFKAGTGSEEDEQGRFMYLYEEGDLLPIFAKVGFCAIDAVRTLEERGPSEVSWIAYFLRSRDGVATGPDGSPLPR